MAHVAELLDELLPDREANDAVFRLTLSVLAGLRGPDVWMPVTYFELWMTRLVGFLPDLGECMVCGRTLNGSRAFFHALADGLMCVDDKRLASSEISPESRTLAAQMFRAPLESFAGMPWPKKQGSGFAEVSDSDSAAAHREEAGHCGNAGEDQRLESSL